MMKMTYNFKAYQTTKIHQSDERNVIVSGTTTIDGVRHKIENKYILCNSSLNGRAWGVTPEQSKCIECFKEVTFEQLKLF
jgi:hypothetical protein